MSGEIPMSFVVTGVALPFVRSGELRALAVSTEQRSSQMPDVPTLSESGTPGLSASSDFAMFAPANTPEPIIRRLSQAVMEGLRAPDMRERLQGEGMIGPNDLDLLQVYDEPQQVVDAIFAFYSKRGFAPSPAEREVLLNL